MKHIKKISFLTLLIALSLLSCQKKVAKEPAPNQRVMNELTPPSDLMYSDTLFVVFGRSAVSVVPHIKGSRPIRFEIVNNPDNRFTINTENGQVTALGGIPVGTYQLSIKATNDKTSIVKNSALIVVVQVNAPTTLAYQVSFAMIDSGTQFVSVPATSNASNVTYRINNRTAIPNGVTIDSLTGVITFPDTMRTGIYRVQVQARNSAGVFTRSDAFILTVRPRGYTPGTHPTWSWEIRPILARRGCTNCHATRGNIRGLGTDYQTLINKHNEVMQRVTIPAWQPFIMPPPAEGYEPLTNEEIEIFRRWASGGFLQ